MRRSLMIAAAAAALLVCGASAASASSGWTIESTGGFTGGSNDVSCGSAASCMAMGSYNGTGGSYQADYWNGSTWTPQQLSAYMYGVSCSSVTTCSAVGALDPGQSNQTAAAEQWNGSTWVSEPVHTPSGSIQSTLTAVSCPSVTSCTAVGEYESSTNVFEGLTEHWNGIKWNVQSAATDKELVSISCASARNCTAVGNNNSSGISVPEAEHWNGSTWTAEALPAATHPYLYSVSCATATNCTAVGAMEEPGVDIFASLAEQWNGSIWTVEPTPAPSKWIDNQLYAVSCASARNCTAVGVYVYSNARSYAHALAEHWNGIKWAAELTSMPDKDTLLNTVWCVRAGGCQAVGDMPPKGVWTPGFGGPILAEGN